LCIPCRRHKERSTPKYAIATTSSIDRPIFSQSQAAEIISNPPQNPRFGPTASHPRYRDKNPRLPVNAAKYFGIGLSLSGQGSFDLFSRAIDNAMYQITNPVLETAKFMTIAILPTRNKKSFLNTGGCFPIKNTSID
jgi:hypothetical protein